MTEKKSSMVKSAMNGGIVTGGILIFSSIFSYYFTLGTLFQILFFIIILAICIYRIAKKYRDKELEGIISYEKSIGFGLLISLFASIIIAFIVYVELNFAYPAAIDNLLNTMRLQYEKMGIAKSQIDTTMQMAAKIMSPLFIAFMVILFFTFLGFISSLFTSMIVQKEGNTFNNTMKDIE